MSQIKKFKFIALTLVVVIAACVVVLMRNRPSQLRYGVDKSAIKVDVIVSEHGMCDAHAWVEGDRVYIGCGHDESPEPHTSFSIDRWEIWSTKNLIDWEYHTSILPKDTYIGDKPDCFAGDITSRDGKYYWYFSDRTRSTGVAVADKIDGEYRDMLGKPLITPENGYNKHPYDPEIFEEDGVYTICYGVGTYYMATLGDDMCSLATDPQPIQIVDNDGKSVTASDKSTLFKRNDWYYLVYGHRYAMSRNLYGPYLFKGRFLNGGHTSFFEWKNQLYVLQENHETSAFFRGISLKPVFFNEDDTIIIPDDDRFFPGPGRAWHFDQSTMFWSGVEGTEVERRDGAIGGEIDALGATIESAAWLYTLGKECNEITIRIKNNTPATTLRVAIDSRNEGRGFWNTGKGKKNWSEEQWAEIEIKSNSNRYRSYTIPLSNLEIKDRMMQVAIQPAADADSGSWEIDKIVIE
ncbi:MAG: family 43 glycosylhydrolase [Rikenellaceae bacterium]